MERRYIITHEILEDGDIAGISSPTRKTNVMSDELKAKNFIDAMVGCMYDGGKIEIEVKIFGGVE